MGMRYIWQKRPGKPNFELIDVATSRAVGVVEPVSRRWHWSRRTTTLLHGAPAASGSSRLLGDAKRAIVKDLPDAPAE